MPIEGTISSVGAAPSIGQGHVVGKFTPSPSTAPKSEASKAGEGGAILPPTTNKEAAPDKSAPATESPKVEVKDEKEIEKLEEWRIAALAQKDRAIRQRAEAVKAREAELQQREAKLREFETLQQQRIQNYRLNPMQLLNDYGIDYNQLSDYVAKGGWTPEQQAALKLEQTRAQILEQEKKFEEYRKAEEQRREEERKASETRSTEERAKREQEAVVQFQSEIQELIESEPEAYELCLASPGTSVKSIYSKIEEHYEKTGKVLSVKAAADMVEEEIYKELTEFLGKSKKLAPKKEEPPKKPEPQRTLTNRVAAPPPVAATPSAPESESERRARVIREIEERWQAARQP